MLVCGGGGEKREASACWSEGVGRGGRGGGIAVGEGEMEQEDKEEGGEEEGGTSEVKYQVGCTSR